LGFASATPRGLGARSLRVVVARDVSGWPPEGGPSGWALRCGVASDPIPASVDVRSTSVSGRTGFRGMRTGFSFRPRGFQKGLACNASASLPQNGRSATPCRETVPRECSGGFFARRILETSRLVTGWFWCAGPTRNEAVPISRRIGIGWFVGWVNDWGQGLDEAGNAPYCNATFTNE